MDTRYFMLILHLLGVVMGLGTGLAYMFLGIAGSKMSSEDQQDFFLKTASLGIMGHIGLTLLIISGGYLITPYASGLMESPLLLTKLVLVVLLIVVIGLITNFSKKAKKGDTEKYMKKVQALGKVSLSLSLAILVLAVLVFH